ncbi:NUDIX hydrolase [Chitinophaga lutea]
MDWKLLQSEYLHKEPWLTVRKDTCVTPSGVTVDPYFVFEYPDWVCVLAVTEDDKAVIIRQYRHGVRKVLTELPAGVIEAGEAPETAARRELLEETGYAFGELHSLGAVSHNPSTSNNLTHMYLATGGKKVQGQSLDENEEIVVELKTMEELERLLGAREFLQALHVSCLFYGLEKWKALRAK